MAPTKSFRTYSRGNSSVSAVDAFNILFAKNLTQRKLHGKKLKAKKLEIKELPQKIKTILSDDSLRVNLRVNDTFDRVLQGDKTPTPSYDNGSELKNKDRLPEGKKNEKSHISHNASSSGMSMVKKLRSFKNNSSCSMQKASWFDQSTTPGEAITNSLEVVSLRSSSNDKRTHPRKNKDNCTSDRSSPVLLRSRGKNTSFPNTSTDISHKNSATADPDPFKNPKDLLPSNMSISVIAKNNSLLNPLFHNGGQENGLLHSSTPLVSKGGPRISVQPISPINTQHSNNQDELKSYILESLDDIRSWNSSLPADNTCEKIKVAQEESPQKFLTFDLNEFEMVFNQLSAISRKQENSQSKIRSFSLENFEKFHKAIVESENPSTNKVSKNISLSDFESFCESYLKTVSISKESFFDSCRRSGFVTHRKHKILRNSNKKHMTFKDLVVVLDKNMFNISNANFKTQRKIALPKSPTLKQLTVNVTKLSLKSKWVNSKPLSKAKDRIKGKGYQACKKFSLDWDNSRNSHLISKCSSRSSRGNTSKNLMESVKMTARSKNKTALEPEIVITSHKGNQVSSARETSENNLTTPSRSNIRNHTRHTSERMSSNSHSLEKQYISQILTNSIVNGLQTHSPFMSPFAFINRRRPGACQKIYDIGLDENQDVEKDKSRKNYVAHDYSNIIFKTPEKKTGDTTRDAALNKHNRSGSLYVRTCVISPDLFDSYDSDNQIKRPYYTRSQNASGAKTEHSLSNLKYINDSSKMQTSNASILSKSGNTATRLDVSKIIEGQVQEAEFQLGRNELLESFQFNRPSSLSLEADDSHRLTPRQNRLTRASKNLSVTDSECSGNDGVSNEMTSFQNSFHNSISYRTTPNAGNNIQLAKVRNNFCKNVGSPTIKNIPTNGNLSDSYRVTRSSSPYYMRSQNASSAKAEYISTNLKHINNLRKMQTSNASILSKSGNTSTRLCDVSKDIEGLVQEGKVDLGRRELLDNFQSNRLSSLSVTANGSKKLTPRQNRLTRTSKNLIVTDSEFSGNDGVSNEMSSFQDSFLNSISYRTTPNAGDNKQLAKVRNYFCKSVGSPTMKNRTTNGSLRDSHIVTRSSSVGSSKNIKCPNMELTNERNVSICSLGMSLSENSTCDHTFRNDSRRVTRATSKTDVGRSSTMSTSQSHNHCNKELIILVDFFKERTSNRHSVSENQTLSSFTDTPHKYGKARARESTCHSTDKELIIVVDTPDVVSIVSSRNSLRKSSVDNDQVSINCSRQSRRSSRCSRFISFEPNDSGSTLKNVDCSLPLNITSETNQNGNISHICKTLPNNVQAGKGIEQALTDVVLDSMFKIPTLLGFKPKPGKSWRRSLMQQKDLMERSFRESFIVTGVNKSTINGLQNSIECSSPPTYAKNRRMSIKILPAPDVKRIRRRTDLQNYVYSKVISRDVTNNISPPNKLSLHTITARDLVLKYCKQEEPIPFEQAYPPRLLQNCKKIGEGVYGEVFLYSQPDGSSTVMKVIPIEGNQIINGERQKKFHEILSEVAIVSELSNLKNNINNSTAGFCEVQRINCLKGKYPTTLIDHWEEYDNTKGSDNDPPDIFKEDQLYVVLDLGNGGQDLESFVFNNTSQAISMFKQISYNLAIAEEELQFEHRDLHWGNVLVRRVDRNKKISFKHKGKVKTCQSEGIEVTIIDFTLSRMTFDGVVIFNDLGQDPELFQAEGDYQFDIYRLMKDRNCNDWEKFTAYTNVLWLHYIVNKSITALRYKNDRTKSHTQGIKILKDFEECLLEYNSATEFVKECL